MYCKKVLEKILLLIFLIERISTSVFGVIFKINVAEDDNTSSPKAEI